MERKPYDAAYKYLFSSPRIVCQLLHSFVDIPLVKEIRPKDLELIEKSFVSEELVRREADLVFKVNLKGRSAYLYILMEFQSSPDKAIPVRMLNYIMMFYDSLMRRSKAGMLPPVLPILIYNGRRNWNVPLRLEEMIEDYLPKQFIPRFEYFPIIEKNYSDETLLEIKNLVSTIMLIENSRDEEKLQAHVKRVTECLKREHLEDIRLFDKWLLRVFPEKSAAMKIEIPEKGGSRQMLVDIAEKLTQKLMREGQLSEKHNVLIRLADLKFGLEEDEKNLIRNVQEPWLLDSALDAFATGEDKSGVLGKLNQG